MDRMNLRQHNTTLRKLDLRHNPCGDVGSCLGNALAKLGRQFPMGGPTWDKWEVSFWGRKNPPKYLQMKMDELILQLKGLKTCACNYY